MTATPIYRRILLKVSGEALMGNGSFGVDIDVIDPAYAPGTNSVEPGGFTSREIINAVRLGCERGFAGFDVVEVSPDYDSRTGHTSTLAAKLILEAICCLAARASGRTRSWDC